MTAVQLGGGEEVACILGGWSDGEVLMHPHVLRRGDDDLFHWAVLATSGLPEGRAFHSATQVAPGRLLVYGGLGQGCCRYDVALLDLERATWSAPRLAGVPRCVGGRAGHGAAFFPHAVGGSGGGGGVLVLVSGAMRSTAGDSHQDSIDVIDVCEVAGEEAGLRLAWSTAEEWGRVRLPAVRTAFYAPIARSLIAWSGVSERHGITYSLHVIDIDRRCVREVHHDHNLVGAELPAPRGGALCFPLRSPLETLMLCGSDHEDGDELLSPWVMRLDFDG